MRALLAEDDRLFRTLLHRVLVRWGFEPIVVVDGEQALRELTSPGGPRLAILDWMMPNVDGLEVCRRVRAANLSHYVYLVLLTGKTDPGDLVAGLEAGADDYLQKPVNLPQLQLRLRAASRVLEAEERHRTIAEFASDGIITMNSSHVIGFANTAAGAIFGRPAAELVGRTFYELAPGFDAQLERTGPTIDLTGRHSAGRELALEVSFSESIDSLHNRVVTAMIRDATERRARELLRAHTQKLESIGELAAGVAHEINTPIQYIGDNLRFIGDSFRSIQQLLGAYRGAMEGKAAEIAALETAIELDFLTAETPCAISQALEGVDRVAEIVRALKEFSHPSVEAAPVNLNQLIERTALVCRSRWKYVAELTTDFDPELPMVTCMAGEIGQVVLNLLVNGADAIADLAAGKPGMLSVQTKRNGEFIEIRVRDSGTGIPPEARGKIFDPFFTTKPVGSGTGQGLAIAYTIVTRKHRGTITFETEMGVGTTMIVQLPIAGPEGLTSSNSSPSNCLVEGAIG